MTRVSVWKTSGWYTVSLGAMMSTGVCWAGGETARIIRKEATVKAPLAEVWQRWTTSDGVTKLLPQKAKIELAVGGAYEWYFSMDAPEGQRGSEGCKVLAFVPMEMLAFSWNAPPSIAKLREAGAKTQVIVQFEPAGEGQTKVVLTQVITETGPDWDAYHTYFDRAWGHVLDNMKKGFGESPSAETPNVPKAERGKRKQWAYYVRPAREGFMEKPTDEEKKIVQEHASYIQRLTNEGTVVYAGRGVDPEVFPDGSGKMTKFEVPAHGIVVFEADSERSAKAIMEGDPAIREGVFKGKLQGFSLAFQRKSAVTSDNTSGGR